ncbi:metal-sensing transcriptional repressor [Nonomuraea sp. NPDC049480]|uniref:metal-sensing transcriptional repressor n=1 Tax=Nonomuraea sp. NPDC049480 TaxID=3364353 RepID=UPI0037B5A74B
MRGKGPCLPGAVLRLSPDDQCCSGQVHDLTTMAEQDRDRLDIVDEVAAVSEALRAVALTLLERHLRRCVDMVKDDPVAARLRLAFRHKNDQVLSSTEPAGGPGL